MNKINRQELAKAIHDNAVSKGFWAERHSLEHYLMLVITELGKAVELGCSGLLVDDMVIEVYEEIKRDDSDELSFEVVVMHTLGDELADTYILLLNLAMEFDFLPTEEDLERVERKRGFVRNKLSKRKFSEAGFGLTVGTIDISQDEEERSLRLAYVLMGIEVIAEVHGINLPWYINEKMRYNANRPHLYGKKC